MHILKNVLSFLSVVLLATSNTLALAQTCNPNVPLTKPDSRYTYNTAGDEVTDTVTGLIWRRCVEGMIWSGNTCTGTATTYTWEGALAQAVTQTGWHLANLKELQSLVENACNDMAINETAFPATPFFAWSATPSASFTVDAWYVEFKGGYETGFDKKTNFPVRLVRGQ